MEPYWHMVDLFYQQMQGVAEGWAARQREERGKLPDDFDFEYGVKLLNFIADGFDLQEKYKTEAGAGEEVEEGGDVKGRPSCSVLIKHLPGQAELLVGHNTWHEYKAMAYRILKRYSLPYSVMAGDGQRQRVPGHTLTMSSYPATILSLDDFLSASSGLVTTETSLFIYNSSLLAEVKLDRQVLEPVRVMVANRLATTGKQWTEIFSRYNSGTYNNQWMVVDYKQVGEGAGLGRGALWVLEQLPGLTRAEDQTDRLLAAGYWASYNRAFYPTVYQRSGAAGMAVRHGNWFSHAATARAGILARQHHTVSTTII